MHKYKNVGKLSLNFSFFLLAGSAHKRTHTYTSTYGIEIEQRSVVYIYVLYILHNKKKNTYLPPQILIDYFWLMC